MDDSKPQRLPDPWLFESRALMRELDRCRELANQIPITNSNATHFGMQIVVNAPWTLRENIRYLPAPAVRTTARHSQKTRATFGRRAVETDSESQHRPPSQGRAEQRQNTQHHRSPHSLHNETDSRSAGVLPLELHPQSPKPTVRARHVRWRVVLNPTGGFSANQPRPANGHNTSGTAVLIPQAGKAISWRPRLWPS